MNHHSLRIKVARQARTVMAAAHRSFLLCLVLGAGTLSALGAPRSVAESSQDSALASGASSDSAAISGTVRDQSGAALRGVKVILTNERTTAQSVVVTTENGAYLFTPVDAGTYTLATELSGFNKAIRPHLSVTGRQHLNIEFSLVPEPSGSGRQTGGARAAPQQDEAGAGQLLSHFEYDDKPNYKPGEVASSTEPGGYSSGASADSYEMILDYVESERPERNESAGPENSKDRYAPAEPKSLREGRRSETDQAALEAWNENQFFSHGSDLLLHREFAPAAELFQRGVVHFPDSAKLQTGLGIALYARGLYEQAVSVLLHATDMVPSDPRPYLLLARAYNVSRFQKDEVAKHLERLVKLEPKSARARYYYALSLWRGSQGDPGVNADQIEDLLKTAIALDPEFADAPLELGALYAEQGKYFDAIREYRRAIAINPDLAVAHYKLAQTYERTGDRAAAQAELGLYQHLQQTKPASSR